MRIKRVLQGTALTALAAVAWAGVGTTDAAAADVPAANSFPVQDISFELGEEEEGYIGVKIEAPTDNTKEIMVGIGSFNESKKTIKIADNAWSVYDVCKIGQKPVQTGNGYWTYVPVMGADVDLSKLSVTKDNYIAIKSESTDPVYFRISASITKQKYTYNAGTNAIDFTKFEQGNSKTAGTLTKDNTTLYYRTQGGSSYWQYVNCYDNGKFDANNKVFQEYQYQGATLYLRVAGNTNVLNDESKITGGVKDANDKSANPTVYDFYQAGYMPSKEVKLNIAKQANGPSVSANYLTGEVKIPNNTEYRVIASGGAIDKEGTEKDPYSKGSGSNVKVADLLKFATEATGATSGTIEVRKAATTNGKGKAASKWTRVSIEMPDPIDVTGATQNGVAVEGELNKDTVISVTAGAIALKDKTTIEATINNKTKATNGIKVKVPTDCKYGVVVTVGSKTVTVKNDGKEKTIKATAGAEVKIHKAGDKKTKAWANDASQDKVIGKVQ